MQSVSPREERFALVLLENDDQIGVYKGLSSRCDCTLLKGSGEQKVQVYIGLYFFSSIVC